MEDRETNMPISDTNIESDTVEPEETKEKLQKPDDTSQLKNSLEEKNRLCEECLDRLQRFQADFENYKRRSLIEREEIVKYANQELVMKLLETLDNFDSAVNDLDDKPLELQQPENRNERKKRTSRQSKEPPTDDALNTFYEGIKMIHKQLYSVLGGEGLEIIKTKGERFDPYKHEALSRAYKPELEENSIVEEIQKGYMFKSKVIRTAKVIVSTKEVHSEDGREKD
ncbi:MAG: nucleotide exchange factor GrpE [Thermoplasmata archaeon]